MKEFIYCFLGFIFLVFVALIITNVGVTAITGVKINPYLFFGQQTIESNDWKPTNAKIIDYQNNLQLNGKKVISGIDSIVPIAEKSSWHVTGLKVKEGCIQYNSILPDPLPIKVIDPLDGWLFSVKVWGGYEPQDMVPYLVVYDDDGYAWIDYDHDGDKDIFVDFDHDREPDWPSIYGFICIKQKDEFKGMLVITGHDGGTHATTCCGVTYAFTVSVYGDTTDPNGPYFCLDSTEWPAQSGQYFKWDSCDSDIPEKDEFDFYVKIGWSGCNDYCQSFTLISVREYY